jgi:hypothetical protein
VFLGRALNRGNVAEPLSAAAELQFVSFAEALELTLLLADRQPEKFERAAGHWHARFLQEVPNVDLRESQAVLALLAAVPVNRLAAASLAELLSRRRSCERIGEALVRLVAGGVDADSADSLLAKRCRPNVRVPVRRFSRASGCGGDDADMLADTSEGKYHVGERWNYRTRRGEEDSLLTVLKVESSPKLGVIVHVSLDGLRIENPTFQGHGPTRVHRRLARWRWDAD